MPVPEKLIDDDFITEKLRVEFPNGEDGEPSITIEVEVLEAMNGMWKQCMIVRVLGRSVAIAALSRKLRELWNPKGAMYVMDLPRQFFMVRFEKEDEYLAALTGGPWRVFGSYLMVRAWSSEFDPLRDDIATTPVWVRLTNIPVNFYHRSILMGIAKDLGKPVRVDMTTLNFERARFARICVEVNLAKPLKGTVLINGEGYFVANEGLSESCSKCGIYGHLVHGCPKTIAERVDSMTLQTETSVLPKTVPEEIPQQEDGFTQVRGARRGTQMSRQVGIGIREPGEETKRSLRGNSNTKETANIALSNKYGSLEMTMNVDGSKEDMVTGEENKENHDMNFQNRRGKGFLQVKEGLIFSGKASTSTSSKGANKEKWAANKKLIEGNRGKPKKVNNKPVRGLVFGPTKGEISLSESGKRLRVENTPAGRAGGVFKDSMENGQTRSKTLLLHDEEVDNPMESIINLAEQRVADTQTSLQGDGRILSLA
ncbi:PREDICTED: uncharacterized protein LOC106323468 [Brassica oleracea var. oleracea]|uniref:uncharacterized protein LOC106323468 n=1 Tax=Brassica oleracea var. oleracea TaxID=109376 RepID=UPI0006A6C9DB|nr:PREDICTED: uncharacterized protein LOC106323468 [Brassica oleracea var. oleracea]